MMKLLLTGLLVLFTSFPTFAGPGDNWPWGSEMPFPWRGIQGTWSFYSEGSLVYMSFKVVKNRSGTNQLEMTLYQSDTCKVIAEGGGFEDYDHVVRGVLRSPKGAVRLMTIHAFSDNTMKEIYGQDWEPQGKRSRSYTVLNVSSYDVVEVETFQLQKVSTSPTGMCPLKKR
jgi:hypothetical protein